MNPSSLIKAGCFYVLIAAIAFIQLGVTFGGLTHREGMERAQIAREIARGNGFTTKCLRPALIQNEAKRLGVPPRVSMMKDTLYPPLGPWITSIPLRIAKNNDFKTSEASLLKYDRIIAVTNGVFLILSIGLAYRLCSRLFDQRIAVCVAILMLFCQPLWDLARSGLPHCILLFFFLIALLLLHKMTALSEENRPLRFLPLLIGLTFAALVLTKWLTVWLFSGAIIYIGFVARPRAQALVLAFIGFVVPLVPWLIRNQTAGGSPVGPWRELLVMGIGQEHGAMRSFAEGDVAIPLLKMPARVGLIMEDHLRDFFPMIGACLIAPFFFMALFHMFRRKDIGRFRWVALSMWIFAILGMALYGLRGDFPNQSPALQANQLHILFMPLMAAYGLALLSILWSRLNLSPQIPFSGIGHLAIVVALGVLPVLLDIPMKIRRSLSEGAFAPIGYQPNLHRLLGQTSTGQEGSLITDAPWALSWYGDKTAVLYPLSLEEAEAIAAASQQSRDPVEGILLTPHEIRRHLGIKGGPYGPNPLSVNNPWVFEIVRNLLVMYPVQPGDTPPEDIRSLYPAQPPAWRATPLPLPGEAEKRGLPPLNLGFGVDHTLSASVEFAAALQKTLVRESQNN